NWDFELFRLLPSYLKNKIPSERDQILGNWISDFGEVPVCDSCSETADDAFLKPDYAWIEKSNMSQGLKQKLNYIQKNRHQGAHFYISMIPYVGNPEFAHEVSYENMPYPDEGFRLLALYKYWNMIHYFFPHKHLIDKEWNNTLKEYIPKFLNARNELEYEFAAVQVIGDIQDTHANLWGGNNAMNDWKGKYYPPIHVRFVENKLVITDYYNPELKENVGLEIGDIITKINGKKVHKIVEEIRKYYPASNEPTRLRDISADLLRSNEKEIQISYIRDKEEEENKIALYERDSINVYRWYRNDGEKSYKFLDDNIGYVTLKSIKQEDIEIIKDTFINTKGIIIDIRNYPSTFVPFSLGSYFISDTTSFVKFTVGNVNNPGEFTFRELLKIPNQEKYYKGKLIVIVNELSQSQAEYTAMAFRAGDNTTIIGSTTAGADGNVSMINLPGGLRTMISGIGVYYPNGAETQRVGIVPDIEVKPTIEGIRNDKDELIQKAMELIMNK
ncbi:MAG: peptidase S41, partial [Bacteroidetes bacterium]|nr:peptidase S41 [Bacteroidota bacterium]